MATRSALLAALVLTLPPARAVAAPEPCGALASDHAALCAASTSERAGTGAVAPVPVAEDIAPSPPGPPAATLVPAGPAYPIDHPSAGAIPSGEPAAVEVTPPRITDVVEVTAAPPETAPSPRAASEASAAASEASAAASEASEAAATPDAPPAPLTASQRETLRFQMRSYLRQVHERVRAAWAAPLAAGRGARRVALVTVVIARDGRVVETRIDRSSQDEGFDRSALRVLARPYLFPPLPPYYQTDALEVGLRFADPARSRR